MTNEFLLLESLHDSLYNKIRLDELTHDEEFYYLYKHARVDQSELVFNVFKNCQLKFSRPIDFNDPYDCHFDTKIDFSGITRKKFNKEFNREIKEHEWKEISLDFQYELTRSFKINALRDIRTKNFTVACFNNNPLNTLMWSHYADNHKGFLIEFKFPRNDINRLPVPVDYSINYPILTLPWSMASFLSNKSLQIEDLRKIFFTKSLDWKYENEYRLINTNHELATFPANLISSVVFGTKTPPKIMDKVNQIIKDFNLTHNMHVKTYQSQLAKRKYEIVVPNHPRLSK